MVGFGTSSSKKESKRVVVGVGDMAVANDVDAVISTFGLGSCIGIAIYDAGSHVGGLLHIMLPSSSIAAEKSKNQPFLFADTGLEKFASMLKTMGANLGQARCVIAGGASVMASSDSFKIGEKNAVAVKEKLRELSVRIDHEFVGGFSNRSLHLELKQGRLSVVLPSEKKEILLS